MGSTDAYAEDGAESRFMTGKSWTGSSMVFRQKGLTPLVEVGFMPEALSHSSATYRHDFPKGSVFTGWTYPPRDYARWEELVYQFTKPPAGAVRDAKVKSWLWEGVERAGHRLLGRAGKNFQAVRLCGEGILRGAPGAKVGVRHYWRCRTECREFLRAFWSTARAGAIKRREEGSPLSFHQFPSQSAPKWKGDHVQNGTGASTPVRGKRDSSDWGISGMARDAGDFGRVGPGGVRGVFGKESSENGYRMVSWYAAYTAEALNDTLALRR